MLGRSIRMALIAGALGSLIAGCAAVAPGRWPIGSARIRNAGSRNILLQIGTPRRAAEFECGAVLAGEPLARDAALSGRSLTLFPGHEVTLDAPVGDGSCALLVIGFSGRLHAVAWRRGTPPGRPMGDDPAEIRVYPTGDILAGRAFRVIPAE